MPFEVIFPKLYIQCTIEGRTVERLFNNVRHLATGERMIIDGTYRNGSTVMPGQLTTWNTISMNGLSPAAPIATNIPVFGKAESAPASSSFAGLAHYVPDEIAGIPPRPLIRRQSGIIISVRDAALSVPPEPTFASIAFTINPASNVCTTGAAMPFDHGDIIAVMATTAPTATAATPFSVTATFTLVKISTTTFLLRNSAGQIVDFTAAGAGCVAVLVSGVRLPPPMPAGEFFFWDTWQPRCFTEPAATGLVTI